MDNGFKLFRIDLYDGTKYVSQGYVWALNAPDAILRFNALIGNTSLPTNSLRARREEEPND